MQISSREKPNRAAREKLRALSWQDMAEQQLATMRAAVYSAFGGPITVQELPKPEAPPGGVLIEVKATGVCRSDWHGWKGHDSDIADHGLPFVPGHELSGIVAQLGEGVSGFAVGDRVAVPFILSCGGCRECARGRPTICEDQEQPGFTRFGSFAEFVALPRADRNLARLPAEVSFEAAAALGCRGTTAYRAVVQQGRLGEGESVAVFGCGGLGLSCVMMAKAHGAAHQHAHNELVPQLATLAFRGWRSRLQAA